MTPTVAALAVAFTSTLGVPTAFWEASPAIKAELSPTHPAKVTKGKAVILVHGLKLQLVHPDKALRTEQHDWQQPDSHMVKELGRDFDVYAFAYAQSAPVDAVASSQGLRDRVAGVVAAGYREVVLIGHSAGGVIARQFVERYPDAGVTKVIQVACPNYGAVLANIGIGVPKPQAGFIKSLAPEPRREICKACPSPIPKSVEFCTVVCQYGRFKGDSMVDFASQWPEDLQKLGIPAVLVPVSHNNAIKDPVAVKEIAALARGTITRWTDDEVAQARKVFFTPAKTGLVPKVLAAVRDRIGIGGGKDE